MEPEAAASHLCLRSPARGCEGTRRVLLSGNTATPPVSPSAEEARKEGPAPLGVKPLLSQERAEDP